MNILITGGSRGIGRACVERFAADGHSVTFLYAKDDAAAAEVQSATGATALKCDISSSDEVLTAIKSIESVDVLINNAGICGFCLFDAITDEQWKQMIDVNLSGAFYVSREVAKKMIAEKSGRIINIGSMWGERGASCEVVYSAAKAGLRGFTKALAKELGPSGITVNCVEPGFIMTDMNSSIHGDTLREIVDSTPLMRAGTPSDVASLVYCLASDEASFITAQCIGVDGAIIL